MMKIVGIATLCAIVNVVNAADRPSRINEYVILEGHTEKNFIKSPVPHEYVQDHEVPKEHNWNNVDGKSCLTHSLNQHIPQYCGSCWAHASLSALADRIKIARNCEGDDINLSIQFVLNCGGGVAGSCHGGSHTGTYQFLKSYGYVPYDTCQTYIACSSESKEGFCKDVDTTCTPVNTCRTCNTFSDNGGECTALEFFPNATIAEYGVIREWDMAKRVKMIQKEIYTRGPVATGIQAAPLLDYMGGIFDDADAPKQTNHVVSIVGFGEDNGVPYWHVRNSWGAYWGENGFFKVKSGENILGIEDTVAWATPGQFTLQNIPCSEDGKMCGGVEHGKAHEYVDPSVYLMAKE